MASLISRCAVKNVKRFVSSRILFTIYDSGVFSFRNVKVELIKNSFLSKEGYCTCVQELNLDKVADQLQKDTLESKHIKRIEEAFNCTHEEAQKLVKDNRYLLVTFGKLSIDKLNVLKDAGIELHTIKQNIWLLSFDSGK